jgi:hypothetical protein
MGGGADVAEHEERRRVADHAADVVAERQAEPDHDPENADDDHRHQTLQHRRDDVLLLDHPAVEERQPGRHQQDEARRGHHPRQIAGDDGASLDDGIGRGNENGERAHDEQERERRDPAHRTSDAPVF